MIGSNMTMTMTMNYDDDHDDDHDLQFQAVCKPNPSLFSLLWNPPSRSNAEAEQGLLQQDWLSRSSASTRPHLALVRSLWWNAATLLDRGVPGQSCQSDARP